MMRLCIKQSHHIDLPRAMFTYLEIPLGRISKSQELSYQERSKSLDLHHDMNAPVDREVQTGFSFFLML